MFSLHDLRFVLCSRDLDGPRAQRSMGFLNLHYPQINEVRKSDRMGNVDGILQFIHSLIREESGNSDGKLVSYLHHQPTYCNSEIKNLSGGKEFLWCGVNSCPCTF